MPTAAEPQTIELADGTAIVVRAVRRRDKSAIVEAFERLTPESRYRRFFAPLTRLTDRDLAYLTEVDHHDHEALVAFVAESGEPLGAARFVRTDDPGEAEFAVAVVDHWHRHGVGTALLDRLIERAREEGIERLVALVMDDNAEALEVAQHLAPHADPPRRSASGHRELIIDLPGPEEPLGASRLGRLLRAAAGGVVVNPWPVISARIAALRSRN